MHPSDVLLHDEADPRFRVDRSTVPEAGNGLFTARPLAAGERLEVLGALIRAESISDVCTSYANRHKFRLGDFLLVPLGFGGMVNYSDTPNLRKVIEGHRVFLEAIRPIDVGEELFFTYDCGRPGPGLESRFEAPVNRSA